MDIPQNFFGDWLKNKGLKQRTRKEYLYYFGKLNSFQRFNQESISRFLSEDSNRNPAARAFLTSFKAFLLVNFKELSIDEIYYREINEVQIPKLSGRKSRRLIKP